MVVVQVAIPEPVPVKMVQYQPTDPNRFASGHCTWYVAKERKITWRGNAEDWLDNSLEQGYEISNEPRKGDILVEDLSYWGHVSLVTKVHKSFFVVSEMNYGGLYVKTTRGIRRDSGRIRGFIRCKTPTPAVNKQSVHQPKKLLPKDTEPRDEELYGDDKVALELEEFAPI